jgi:hypothetical protein
VHARESKVSSCFDPGAPDDLDCEGRDLVQGPYSQVFGKALKGVQILRGVAGAKLQQKASPTVAESTSGSRRDHPLGLQHDITRDAAKHYS